MLTDAILKEAAAEAEHFLFSIVPEDGEPHVFSKRFERKMQKLIRRANHPIRYQVMRTAAAVALAFVTLFGTVMAVSPEARAAVVGWVKSTFHEFFEYSNKHLQTNGVPSNDDVDAVKYGYHLSVTPEGYREIQVMEKMDGRSYIYMNDTRGILQFTYTYSTISNSLFTEAVKYQKHAAFVNDFPADVYIALNPKETSVIVWQDNKADVLFQITATADCEELIKIATTVTRIEQ